VTVTQDAYSRKYCPATTAEWTELLFGLGINPPTSIWKCDEASGNLVDSGSGGSTVTVSGAPAYRAVAPGWQRTGIKCTDGSAAMHGECTIPDVSTTSAMLLQMFALNTSAGVARGLNRIGTVTAENATLQAGNKLRGTSGANTADGVQQQAGVLIVITKLDRANSVHAVYTKWEQIKATWSAPAASTTMSIFGDAAAASDATLVYAARWYGSDAEIADSTAQVLLNAVYGAELTSTKMQSGSFAMKWVATIEGCPYVPTDAPAAAVINAYAGTDWTDVTKVLAGSLIVDLPYEQSIEPLTPFTALGSCTLRVLDVDRNNPDVFGKFVAKRRGGNETTTTATITRNATTIPVRSTQGFASSGVGYLGTEAIGYSSVAAQAFNVSARGLYSPFGTASSGSGGNRFGNHHRVGADLNHVQRNPVFSSVPRTWIGKRVALRLHTWDPVTQSINSWREAQLVWAGRISKISDDHNDVGITNLTVDHEMSYVSSAPIFRDPLGGEVSPGLYMVTGRVISFNDKVTGVARKTATPLTVVAGAPANANQMQVGTYSLTELCDVINKWLASELAATRIGGMYSLSSPVSTNDGMRTRIVWNNTSGASTTESGFNLALPSEVAAFLGLVDGDPTFEGQTVNFQPSGGGPCSTVNLTTGPATPFLSLIFRPSGPGTFGQEFSSSAPLDLDNVRGSFSDTYSDLPASIKAKCDPTAPWGVFMFDEKILLVGTYSTANKQLTNCWIAPFKIAANDDSKALNYIGRRADETDAGPVPIRQVAILTGTRASLILQLFYSSGVAGYNHATWDQLGYGLGVNTPGSLFGTEFETELANLPGSSDPIMVMIDEATRLADVIAGDMNYMWAFFRWKNQHFGIAQWRTPLVAYSVATLTEDNKAAQPGEDNHRVISEETDEFRHSIIKVDFCRDVGFGRKGNYHQSFQFEDQAAVDDADGAAKPATIQLQNTFQEFANTGSSVVAGMPLFQAHMPTISAASRRIERTMDHRYFEQLAPGDIVTVVDDWARDPLTGARGVLNRAAFVTGVHYDLGGPTGARDGAVRPMAGEVRMNFLDTQRGSNYAPAAEIDSTANSGGFSAGYNSGTNTIRCVTHAYSHVIVLPDLFQGGTRYITEPADAQSFLPNDVAVIVQIDPANTAAPITWQRTVLSQSGNDITFTAALSAPAWDATKLYRVIPAAYLSTQVSQRQAVFMADATDEMVQDTDIPWHFSTGQEDWGSSPNVAYDPGEFVADLCYGDGKPWDVGYDKAIARTINAFVDNVTAHQGAFLARSTKGPSDTASTTWEALYYFPFFLGTEQLSATVKRTLTVAPWFRSSSAGSTGKIRVTIVNQTPVKAAAQLFTPGQAFRDPIKTGAYQVSSQWSSTSTTWGEGASVTLDLSGVKDIFFGFVFVMVEGTGFAECRGLSQCFEGYRTVNA
jgi:hypothetical protein